MIPKISIIIPVYNAELFLRECLDSIFMQTFNDFELICVNDGSTDSSVNILNEYKVEYTNMYIINQKNRGIGVATNRAIEEARGEYLYSLDNDDFLIDENVLEFLYESAKDNDLDILTFNYKTETNIKRVKQPNKIVLDAKEYLLNEYIPPLWSRLCRLKYIKEIKFKFLENISFVDTEATPRLFLRAKRIMHVDKVLYHWRRQGNEKLSISQNLNNLKSAYSYMYTTKTYHNLYQEEKDKKLKKVFKKERFKAIIEVSRIVALVNTDEGYKLLKDLKKLGFGIMENKMIDNEKKFFYNTYIINKKKIKSPYIYLIRKVTKFFI